MRIPDPIARLWDFLREGALDGLRWIGDLPALAARHPRAAGAGGIAAVALVAWAVIDGPLAGDDGGIAGVSGDGGDSVIVFDSVREPGEVGALGFPLVATRNTTRVAGTDPTADAAAVALATHPPGSSTDPIEAAVLVDDADWQGGIAAAVLTGPPLRAPLLLTDGGRVPSTTGDALERLDPRGGGGPGDPAVYTIGEAAHPGDLAAERIGDGDPAEVAAAVDHLRGRLLREQPRNIVIASSEEAAFAMPAAAWAARSGDPVLFAGRDELPAATASALKSHPAAAVYVLGPESVISEEVRREIAKITPNTTRVSGETASDNAIEFARYADTRFGWNINDPGHGIVIANSERPLDAAAAASLSASGQWGPLLLVDDPDVLDAALRSFLLDIKPGYRDDPTRAVYNRIWLIGDDSALSARSQAELDELAEVVEIDRGAGGIVDSPDGQSELALPDDAEPEPEPDTAAKQDRKKEPRP